MNNISSNNIDNLQENMFSCKYRLYPNEEQNNLLNNYFYVVQKFRNSAVAFCNQRRKKRKEYLEIENNKVNEKLLAKYKKELTKSLNEKINLIKEKNKNLSQDKLNSLLKQEKKKLKEENKLLIINKAKDLNLDLSIFHCDVQKFSKEVTSLLNKARNDLKDKFDITVKKGSSSDFLNLFNSFDLEKQNNIKEKIPNYYLLTVARTVLDQCLQDMAKTYNKAIKDLANKNIDNKKENNSKENNNTSLPEKFTKTKTSKNIKTEEHLEVSAGFPQFKKHNYSCSVRFQITSSRNKEYTSTWAKNLVSTKLTKYIFVPSIGNLKIRDRLGLPNIIPELITIKRNSSGKFYISFLNKEKVKKNNQEKQEYDLPTQTVYFQDQEIIIPRICSGDLGLSSTLTICDEKQNIKEIKRQRFLKKYENKLKFLQSKLSKRAHIYNKKINNNKVNSKKVYSKRYYKLKNKVAVLHEKISNWRDYFLRQEAIKLASSYSIICLEKLSLKNILMSGNKSVTKSAADASLGKFVTYIKQEANKRGIVVLQVPQYYASSKICSKCLVKNTQLKLEKIWTCSNCNKTHQRDENASLNIKVKALKDFISLLKQKDFLLESSNFGLNNLILSLKEKQECLEEIFLL